MLELSKENKIFACRDPSKGKKGNNTYIVIIPDNDGLIVSSLNIDGNLTNLTHETAALGIKMYYDLILKGWRIMSNHDIENIYGYN